VRNGEEHLPQSRQNDEKHDYGGRKKKSSWGVVGWYWDKVSGERLNSREMGEAVLCSCQTKSVKGKKWDHRPTLGNRFPIKKKMYRKEVSPKAIGKLLEDFHCFIFLVPRGKGGYKGKLKKKKMFRKFKKKGWENQGSRRKGIQEAWKEK